MQQYYFLILLALVFVVLIVLPGRQRKKVAAQIKSGMKFKTLIGDLSYDKKGDVTRLDYTVYIWKKDPSGKITYSEIE